MRLHIAALALALTRALAHLQPAATASTAASTTVADISDALPSCAEPALIAAVQATGCQFFDAHCICSNARLLPSLISAITAACDPADQATVVAFARTYCGISVVSSEEAALFQTTAAPTTNDTSIANSSTSSGVEGTNAAVAPSRAPMTTSTGSIGATSSMLMSSNITTSLDTQHQTTTTTSRVSSGANTPGSTALQDSTTAGSSAPQDAGSSLAAFAIAVFAMSMIFAEL